MTRKTHSMGRVVGSESRAARRTRHARSTLAVLVMTVATVSAFVTSTGSARAQSAGGVRQLGSLELPTNKDSLHDYTPVAIDVARRRVYVRYTVVGPVTHIVEYDLSRTIPRLLRDVVVPVVNPNANNLAFDDRRGVAYIL